MVIRKYSKHQQSLNSWSNGGKKQVTWGIDYTDKRKNMFTVYRTDTYPKIGSNGLKPNELSAASSSSNLIISTFARLDKQSSSY